MYSQAFNADPSNLEALAGLGKALLAAGQADAAKELLDSLEDDAKADPQIASLATMVKLADEAADSVAKLAEYQAAVDADDSNLDAKYHLAVALFGAGQRDAGLDQLLAIIKQERTWNDDAARKKLLEYMEAFGAKDPFTIHARKALSAVLFSLRQGELQPLANRGAKARKDCLIKPSPRRTHVANSPCRTL